MNRPLTLTSLGLALLLAGGSIWYSSASVEDNRGRGREADPAEKSFPVVSAGSAGDVDADLSAAVDVDADSASFHTAPRSYRQLPSPGQQTPNLETLQGEDADNGEEHMPSQVNAFSGGEGRDGIVSDSKPKIVGGGGSLTFLRTVYRQALREAPELAPEIARQIAAIENQSQLGVDNADTGAVNPGDGLSSGEAGTLPSNSDSGPHGSRPDENNRDDSNNEDTTADEDVQPSDEDFAWCQNRPPAVPGQFRCPCPSDPNYQPDWRNNYNPEIPAAAGC